MSESKKELQKLRETMIASHYDQGHIGTYNNPAGGWGALKSTTVILNRQDTLSKGSITLLDVNQPRGIDCPGCAWPDGKEKPVNFCENGAKAIAFEATNKKVTAEFFAQFTVTELSEQSDYFLENQGRLTHPMRYNSITDKYEPISWDDAFAFIGQKMQSIQDPDEVAFYTSGRASNESAYMYQLFARSFGTNNFPDCSNMCHEPTSVGLKQSIGLGKATVTMEDFEQTDTVFSFGHNPGSNHPRMLGTLREVSRRGGTIIAINPVKERGLQKFQDPQAPLEMATNGSTKISRYYFQPHIGSDYAILLGMFKHLQQWDKQALDMGKDGIFDRDYIAKQTEGFDALIAEVERTEWADIHKITGLPAEQLQLLAELYRDSKKPIFCWGMGITQHRHATSNIYMLANLMLAMGHIGKAGAGLAPIRGHSNVQGNRTMGIWETPAEAFLQKLDNVFAIQSPRKHGYSVISTIQAMQAGKIKIFIGLGGNFTVASPDSLIAEDAMRQCDLTIQIQTKLNRSHLIHGKDALILPCLGRTEIDRQRYGEQMVTIEDSMCYVKLSAGRNEPASPDLLSETDIVCRMAEAALPNSPIQWRWYVENYDRIRDVIAQTVDGFEDFNARVYQPHGFRLEHPANHQIWNTPTGKAQFLTTPLQEAYDYKKDFLAAESLPVVNPLKVQRRYTLMTTRSHDQFNTTIYGLDDRYRGVFETRRVLFMNPEDIAEAGLQPNDWVNIESLYNDGVKRIVKGFRVVSYDIPRGDLAAYYPETNPLVALNAYDKGSSIPAYKSVPVMLHRGSEPVDGQLAYVYTENQAFRSADGVATLD